MLRAIQHEIQATECRIYSRAAGFFEDAVVADFAQENRSSQAAQKKQLWHGVNRLDLKVTEA